MNFQRDIITARKCPYCGKRPEHVDSKVVYGRSYGMIYLCKPCNAYVGTHRDKPKKALGRLANKQLREAKKLAHKYFDQLWQRKMLKDNIKKHEARTLAYKWLSKQLSVPLRFTHIGMFDEDLCNKVVEVCKPYYKKPGHER